MMSSQEHDRRSATRGSSLQAKLFAFIPVLIFTVAVVVAWQLIVTVFELPPILLPSPAQVLEAGIQEASVLASGAWVTGTAAVSGFAMSVLLGTLIAALMSQSQ